MQVTCVGHAGFRIDTKAGSILCDPWVNPAYFASWFPFPDNSALDWDALGDVDYLYVPHLHRDHFDPRHLREHVNKDAVVLLPDFPVPDLQRELEKVGFHRFFETTDSVKHRVSGPMGDLDVMIVALRAPADGPLGDSALVVSDGVTTAFNMNDARPVDLDVLASAFGHIDVHMLQYSGAIWYPMVYDMPARAKEAFGTQKRQRQMDRCRQYIAQVGATWVVPSAGPPCFLDPELRDLNDDHGDPANIFPDQMVFLDQMRAHGHDGGLLMIPGSSAHFTGSQLNSLTHPMPDPESIFTTSKAAYIADSYRFKDVRGRGDQRLARWRRWSRVIDYGLLITSLYPIATYKFAGAPLVVMYADFTCPRCAVAALDLRDRDDARVVFRHFALKAKHPRSVALA